MAIRSLPSRRAPLARDSTARIIGRMLASPGRWLLLALLSVGVWVGGCHNERIGGPASGLMVTMAAAGNGDGQSGAVLTPLAGPLRVRVLRDGMAAAGVEVTWSVPAGQGSISAQTTMTDADGIAAVTRMLGPVPGEHMTEASVAGAGGSPVRFTATALDPLALAIVSNPVSVSIAGALTGAGTGTSAMVVYVSLPQGAIPNGTAVTVREPGGGSATTAMVDGGFDPLPVVASVGDTVYLEIRMAGGGSPQLMALAVPATRRPRVVRTDPPRGKRDVPLNASLIIVVSEPVAGASLSAASVQVFRGSSAVAGSVTLLPGSGTAIAFTPAAALDADTDYRLVVTEALTDRDGSGLEAAQSLDFTTGRSNAGPPASIDVSPDSLYLSGTTYQLTATVRDAAGTELIGQPVSWSSSDTSGLAVSAGGVLTARLNGSYQVRARTGALEAAASVFVAFAGPAASLTISTLGSVGPIAYPGSVVNLFATVRDASGNVILNSAVSWTSSAPAIATVTSAPWWPSRGAVARGVALGLATITATSGSLSGTLVLNVIAPSGVPVTVVPESLSLAAEDEGWVDMRLINASGDTVPMNVSQARRACWESMNPAVLEVGYPGSIFGGLHPPPCVGDVSYDQNRLNYPAHVSLRARAQGSTILVGSIDGRSDTIVLTVGPRRIPVSLKVIAYPDTGHATVLLGHQVIMSAIGFDANGVAVSNRPKTWTSANPAVATVGDYPNYAAVVTPVAPGSTVISVATEGLTAQATLTVPLLAFGSLSTGGGMGHTCGVITAGTTWCWGLLFHSPDWYDRFIEGWHATPLRMGGAVTLVSVAVGGVSACGLTATGSAHCWDIPFPNAKPSYSIGARYVPDWPDTINAPLALPGGLTFASLDAGEEHFCGLDASGTAYCWGSNLNGQLGNGSMASSPAPVAVAGGHTFVALTAGGFHSCGLTNSGAAWCWGWNAEGQLGDGTTIDRPVPVLVSGAAGFVSLTAGYAHSCGLTATGEAWCWGGNRSGELGNGTTSGSLAPIAVSGLRFATLSAGSFAFEYDEGAYREVASNTCGLALGGVAYCWGENGLGQLGDGSTVNRSMPTPVQGGLLFASLSAGGNHSCGTTTTGVAYCWGTFSGPTPVKLIGSP